MPLPLRGWESFRASKLPANEARHRHRRLDGDRCNTENSCLQVVPRSREPPVLYTLYTAKADRNAGFTDLTVPVPEGLALELMITGAGDVLSLNERGIHNHFPDRSRLRLR